MIVCFAEGNGSSGRKTCVWTVETVTIDCVHFLFSWSDRREEDREGGGKQDRVCSSEEQNQVQGFSFTTVFPMYKCPLDPFGLSHWLS